MKYFTIIITFLTIIYSCKSKPNEETKPLEDKGEFAIENKIGGYGLEIDSINYISIDSMVEFMQNKPEYEHLKVKGHVAEVCLKKGCWLNLKASKKDIRVEFKDYAFFAPLNCAGQDVFALGRAHWDTTSIEMLQHLAEDAKKSKDEIAKITQPELELIFEAEGILFQK